MSMEDWDFGYYGKGLDGYVHFRQGIKEIESHAPYSKCRHGRDDSLDDLDEYDDPEDDLFYEPPQKTPVSSAKPVMRRARRRKQTRIRRLYRHLRRRLSRSRKRRQREVYGTRNGGKTSGIMGLP